MEGGRWLNASQPQTLQIAVFLLYFDALFFILSFSASGLIIGAGAIAAGWGISSERKWGYWLGLAISVYALYPYVLIALTGALGVLFSSTMLLISFLIVVAQFVLLVHPMSRSYQKLWFK